mgnify:CR=1 FL=1
MSLLAMAWRYLTLRRLVTFLTVACLSLGAAFWPTLAHLTSPCCLYICSRFALCGQPSGSFE